MRTAFATLLAFLTITTAAPAVPPAADVPAPDDTPVFQGGPAHAGRILDAGVEAPLERAWSVALGLAQQGALLVDGTVYLRAQAGQDRPVVALDVEDGSELWRAPIDRYAVVDHLAYAAGRILVGGHDVWALDAATGAQLWRSPEPGEWPVVAGDVVVTNSHPETVARRLSDGALLWRQPVTDLPGAPSLVGDRVVVGMDCFAGFQLGTGTLAWSGTNACARLYEPPAYDGGLMWAAAGGPNEGVAFDAQTGAIAFRFTGDGPAFAAPYAYQVRGRELVALDSRTQAVEWAVDLLDSETTLPLVVDELVLVATRSRLVAVDRETGDFAWSGPLTAEGTGSGLAAGDGHVVVPTATGADVFRTADVPTGDDEVDPELDEEPEIEDEPELGEDSPLRPRVASRLKARVVRSGSHLRVIVRARKGATGVVRLRPTGRAKPLRGGRARFRLSLPAPRKLTVAYAGDARFRPARVRLVTPARAPAPGRPGPPGSRAAS